MNTKTPLVLLLIVFQNNKINDENKYIFIKFFFKYHINLSLEYDLLELYNEFNYNNTSLTYNLILDIYNVLKKQINYIQFIKKFKLSFNLPSFWKKNIDEQINYLKNMHKQLLIIFDGSKTQLYFHIRLKSNTNDLGNNYHIEQIMERLKKTVSLFKLAFFREHDIYILSNFQFMDLTFNNMVKYTEYIFNKVNNHLLQYISYFEHYNHYRIELINLLDNNQINEMINIDVDEISSDIDIDDIDLIMKD